MQIRVRTILSLSILDSIDPLDTDTDTQVGDVSMSFRQSWPIRCARGRLMLDLLIRLFCYHLTSRELEVDIKEPAANGCIIFPPHCKTTYSLPVHMSDTNQNYAT